MDSSPTEDDLLEEDSSDLFINFPPEVQRAIDEVVHLFQMLTTLKKTSPDDDELKCRFCQAETL